MYKTPPLALSETAFAETMTTIEEKAAGAHTLKADADSQLALHHTFWRLITYAKPQHKLENSCIVHEQRTTHLSCDNMHGLSVSVRERAHPSVMVDPMGEITAGRGKIVEKYLNHGDEWNGRYRPEHD